MPVDKPWRTTSQPVTVNPPSTRMQSSLLTLFFAS
jgi:hypothetical protein